MSVKRTWHGCTTPQNAEAYETLLREQIFPRIESREIPGYRGVELLRMDRNGEVEFMTVMTFDSIESVRAFQGSDYERAWVPDEAQRVLTRWDDRAEHYIVVESRPRG